MRAPRYNRPVTITSDVRAYLDRINYQGPRKADTETLKHLQLAHLLAVPFENLSIHAREPIVLDEDALFGKIVFRRRGGFCYELNGLFAWLLRQLGFDVAMVSAQAANANGDFGPDFDHMALIVTGPDGRRLVDVGFGDSFIEPLPLDVSGEHRQRDNSYRIVAAAGLRFLLQRALPKDEWKPQYQFMLQPYQFSDFAAMCLYHQTSAESHFTRQRICSRLTPSGRISLTDSHLIVTENGVRHETPVPTDEERSQILTDQFGIVM